MTDKKKEVESKETNTPTTSPPVVPMRTNVSLNANFNKDDIIELYIESSLEDMENRIDEKIERLNLIYKTLEELNINLENKLLVDVDRIDNAEKKAIKDIINSFYKILGVKLEVKIKFKSVGYYITPIKYVDIYDDVSISNFKRYNQINKTQSGSAFHTKDNEKYLILLNTSRDCKDPTSEIDSTFTIDCNTSIKSFIDEYNKKHIELYDEIIELEELILEDYIEYCKLKTSTKRVRARILKELMSNSSEGKSFLESVLSKTPDYVGKKQR